MTDDDLAADLRIEVGRFRASQPLRVFGLHLHAGRPAGDRRSIELPWPLPADHDAGLLYDVLVALLGSAEPSDGDGLWVWLTRPGLPLTHDADLLVHAAAHRAAGVEGFRLRGVHALTRSGWLDVATGESRTWKRLRLRTGGRG